MRLLASIFVLAFVLLVHSMPISDELEDVGLGPVVANSFSFDSIFSSLTSMLDSVMHRLRNFRWPWDDRSNELQLADSGDESSRDCDSGPIPSPGQSYRGPINNSDFSYTETDSEN